MLRMAIFCNQFKILASYELQGRRRSVRAGYVNTHRQKSSGVNMSNMTKYGNDCAASFLSPVSREGKRSSANVANTLSPPSLDWNDRHFQKSAESA